MNSPDPRDRAYTPAVDNPHAWMDNAQSPYTRESTVFSTPEAAAVRGVREVRVKEEELEEGEIQERRGTN